MRIGQTTVTASPVPAIGQTAGLTLQRKCDCGQHTIGGGGCSECEKKKGTLQRKASSSEPANDVPPIVHDVLRSPGQKLDAATRAFMEPRFGHDFSRVRVHTDRRAADSASVVKASAYTVGHHIVFASGQYAPSTSLGRKLLAHELTHTVQQGAGLGQNSAGLEVVTDGSSEQEADVVAAALSSGHSAMIGREHGLRLARQVSGSISAVPTYATATLKPAGKEPCPFRKGSCVGGKWNFEYDGCTAPESLAKLAGLARIDPNNPAGGSKTQFALCSTSGGGGRACDRHDECYQTCNPTSAAQEACDQRMYQHMLATCLAYSENSAMLKKCASYATVYFWVLRAVGRAAFCERQLEVCACEKNPIKLAMAKKLCNVALEKPERSLAPPVSTAVARPAVHGSYKHQEFQLEKPERSLAPPVSTAVTPPIIN